MRLRRRIAFALFDLHAGIHFDIPICCVWAFAMRTLRFGIVSVDDVYRKHYQVTRKGVEFLKAQKLNYVPCFDCAMKAILNTMDGIIPSDTTRAT